jgi:hypothetical protein
MFNQKNKKSLIIPKNFLFLFIFLFLFFLSFVSACGPGDWDSCDYYINDSDGDDICLDPGNVTYIFNLSDYYDWSDGDIGIGENNYEFKAVWRINETHLTEDSVYLDESSYYYWIPYNTTYPVAYSFNYTIVIETQGVLGNVPSYDHFIVLVHDVEGTLETFSDFGVNNSCNTNYPTGEDYYAEEEEEEEEESNATGLLDSLLAYWKLDESSGDAIDSVGSNDGTVSGATQGVTGKIIDSYSFDGINDKVEFGSDSSLDPGTSDFSISLWFKTSTDDRDVLWCNGGDEVTPRVVLYTKGSSGDFEVQIRDSGSSIDSFFSDTDGTFYNGLWHHLVVNLDRDGNVSFYLDGSSHGVDDISAFDGDTIWSGSSKTTIGNKPNSDTQAFNGLIDEVGYWNRTLNSSEIQALYNSGSGLAYSEFGEGEGGGDNNVTKLKEVDDITLDFVDSNWTNLSNYFENWYELAVVYNDSLDENETNILITGYSADIPEYYDLYMGLIGGYDNFSIVSYEKNYTGNLVFFACDNQSDIDTFCPVSGFPGTCNVSAFYDDLNCVWSTTNLTIVGSYVPEVNQTEVFSAYYTIEDFGNQSFSIADKFTNYETVNVSYVVNDSFNASLVCDTVNGSYLTFNDSVNMTLDCTEYPDWLSFNSNNITINTTIHVTASNSNNSVSDSFILITGQGGVEEEDPIDPAFNWTALKEMFPDIEDEQQAKFFGWIVVVALLAFAVIFIGVPLKFNKFSIVVIVLFGLFGLFVMAFADYLSWSWFVVPVVLLTIYFVLSKLRGGSG